MSREVEKSDLTAGGDAPPVEAIKIDCLDDTVAIVAVKNTDVLEDATAFAGEIAKEVLSARDENGRSTEATNNANVSVGEEVANSEAHTAEIINIVTEIIRAPAGDAVPAEARESAEESNSSTPQSEGTLEAKSANEEKV